MLLNKFPLRGSTRRDERFFIRVLEITVTTLLQIAYITLKIYHLLKEKSIEKIKYVGKKEPLVDIRGYMVYNIKKSFFGVSTVMRKKHGVNKIYKIAPHIVSKRDRRNMPRIAARADEQFGRKNYAEFSVARKREGMYALSRVLMVLFYIFATLAYVFFCTAVKYFLWFLVILPVFVMVIIYFTWWRVSVEYKYTVDNATFTVKTVYGGRYERLLFEEKIKNITLVAPYEGEYKEKADSLIKSASEISYAVSSKKASNICFAVCDGKIVFFEMTPHAYTALKYYNSAVIVGF